MPGWLVLVDCDIALARYSPSLALSLCPLSRLARTSSPRLSFNPHRSRLFSFRLSRLLLIRSRMSGFRRPPGAQIPILLYPGILAHLSPSRFLDFRISDASVLGHLDPAEDSTRTCDTCDYYVINYIWSSSFSKLFDFRVWILERSSVRQLENTYNWINIKLILLI